METNQDETSRQSVEESTTQKDKQSLQQEHKDKVNSLVWKFSLYLCSLHVFIFLKSQDEKQLQERIEKILNILTGEITIGVHMQFLIKNNHADLLILKQIKVRWLIIQFSFYNYNYYQLGCCTKFSMSYSYCYCQWLYVIGYNQWSILSVHISIFLFFKCKKLILIFILEIILNGLLVLLIGLNLQLLQVLVLFIRVM